MLQEGGDNIWFIYYLRKRTIFTYTCREMSIDVDTGVEVGRYSERSE